MELHLENGPVLMGVVNLTPDSFYAPSRVSAMPELSARVADLTCRGCSILDLGAVSTRPGAEEVSEEEEWRRLEPALEVLGDRMRNSGVIHRGPDFTMAPSNTLSIDQSPVPSSVSSSIILSVDTTRSSIVRRVFEAVGPFIVNDISAGEDDPDMLPTVASLGLPFIAMHKRGDPRTMDSLVEYPRGVVEEVVDYFREFSHRAEAAGLQDWILDPGFGFAKTVDQNWELLRNLPKFKQFSRPILVGVADKRFTRQVPPDLQERFGSGAPGSSLGPSRPNSPFSPELISGLSVAERLALSSGADILRIH